MYPPGPSSHPLPDPNASATDAEKLAELRYNTNFRSVTRNDPAVQALLDTSVYSVIYQYDEQTEAWEKQKQEGPMFVVKRCVGVFLFASGWGMRRMGGKKEGDKGTDPRNKDPVYALFMLNRQAVKNVTLPLIPGEIKCSIVDPSTLQVARRGESTFDPKLKRKGVEDRGSYQRSAGEYGSVKAQKPWRGSKLLSSGAPSHY